MKGQDYDLPAGLLGALDAFVQRGEPPLILALVQISDWKEQVFVSVKHSEYAARILASFEITSGQITSKAKYSGLRTARLENGIKRIVTCALGSEPPGD